jgi:hypothetical protein
LTKLYRDVHSFSLVSSIVTMVKARKLRWMEYTTVSMGQTKNYKLLKKPHGK